MITEEQRAVYQKTYKKASRVEFEIRVQYVMELLNKGYNYDEICRNMSQEFDISIRQTQRYLKIANKRIQSAASEQPVDVKLSLLSQYKEIYKVATGKGDLKSAMKALNHIAELHGLLSKELLLKGSVGVSLSETIPDEFKKEFRDYLISKSNAKS